jgi:hypothetical protein
MQFALFFLSLAVQASKNVVSQGIQFMIDGKPVENACLPMEPEFDLQGYTVQGKEDFFRRFNATQVNCPTRKPPKKEEPLPVGSYDLVTDEEMEAILAKSSDFECRTTYQDFEQHGSHPEPYWPCDSCCACSSVSKSWETCYSAEFAGGWSAAGGFLTGAVGASYTVCNGIQTSCNNPGNMPIICHRTTVDRVKYWGTMLECHHCTTRPICRRVSVEFKAVRGVHAWCDSRRDALC